MDNKSDLYKEALKQASDISFESANKIMAIAENINEKELALLQVLAALQPDARKKVMDYWKGQYGSEYSKDMVKDYLNPGEKQKVEANSKNLKKEALSSPKSDANNPVEKYYKNLRGKEYSKDMVKYPTIDAKTMEVKALSQGLQKTIASMEPEAASELLAEVASELLTMATKKN